MGFSLPSFAKINWDLRILGKRPDGFHELCTIFQTVSLSDRLTFDDSDELALTCDDPAIPTDERNLIIKAAKLLQTLAGRGLGARLGLEKKIPSPGGLGGGSSNAAAALIGLNRLWNLGLSIEQMHPIAAKLGSDVPFFLYGGTALGTGRGEAIEPAKDIIEPFLLVVTPNIAVSTKDAFGRIDANRLTNEDSDSILRVCRFIAKTGSIGDKTLKNDLEPSVFGIYPEIARVKKTLLGLGAIHSMMSGSGASVFALFDKKETRQAAIKAIEHENWRRFAVATVSRDEYREQVYGEL